MAEGPTPQNLEQDLQAARDRGRWLSDEEQDVLDRQQLQLQQGAEPQSTPSSHPADGPLPAVATAVAGGPCNQFLSPVSPDCCAPRFRGRHCSAAGGAGSDCRPCLGHAGSAAAVVLSPDPVCEWLRYVK